MSVKRAIQLYVLVLTQALTPTFYEPPCASNPYLAVA
jgi:hypothetical protein